MPASVNYIRELDTVLRYSLSSEAANLPDFALHDRILEDDHPLAQATIDASRDRPPGAEPVPLPAVAIGLAHHPEFIHAVASHPDLAYTDGNPYPYTGHHALWIPLGDGHWISFGNHHRSTERGPEQRVGISYHLADHNADYTTRLAGHLPAHRLADIADLLPRDHRDRLTEYLHDNLGLHPQ